MYLGHQWVTHEGNEVSLQTVVGLDGRKDVAVNLPKSSVLCQLMVGAGRQSKVVEGSEKG
jgi:hypothetical protein